jgi:hypothetical protein
MIAKDLPLHTVLSKPAQVLTAMACATIKNLKF